MARGGPTRRRAREAIGGMRHAARTLAGGTGPGAPPDQRARLSAITEIVRRQDGGIPGCGDELTPYEQSVSSQNGEDGVVAELLRRSGASTSFFVEFGASTGAEGNCVLLADVFSWRGVFIEADDVSFRRLSEKYEKEDRVTCLHATVAVPNIEDLLARAQVPREFDVLSIDIDGADYWVWEAIRNWSPRIVIIEYNSALGFDRALVQPPDRRDAWDGTDYFGASMAALRRLGEQKGYRLVHTELAGVNAFFVRDDLPGDYPSKVPLRSPNFGLAGIRHPSDPEGRPYVDLDRVA